VSGYLDSGYTYNDEGQIASLSYPTTNNLFDYTDGPVYNYTYDSMNRLNGMTSAAIPWWATSATTRPISCLP